MKKIIIIFCGLILILVFLICIKTQRSESVSPEDLNSTVGSYSNYGEIEPDDVFSENVMSAVGDCFIYKGKESFDKCGTIYEFFIWKESPESIVAISKAINEYTGIITDQSEIRIEDGGAGYYYTVIKLFNYYDTDQGELNYDGFFSMRIEWNEMSPIWEDPTVYLSFEGIKRLEIPDKLQEKADEQGVDWYEVWPNLEEVVVYDTGD